MNYDLEFFATKVKKKEQSSDRMTRIIIISGTLIKISSRKYFDVNSGNPLPAILIK
jgi:hypothetical protein